MTRVRLVHAILSLNLQSMRDIQQFWLQTLDSIGDFKRPCAMSRFVASHRGNGTEACNPARHLAVPIARHNTSWSLLSKIASTLVLLTRRTSTSRGLRFQRAIGILAAEKGVDSISEISTRLSLAWRNLG